MKRAMLVGAIGCGKTTLTQRLKAQELKYNKTQAIEFSANIIDTPGEYMEHHRMINTLETTSVEAELVVLLQSAVDNRLIFPAGFCSMFNKPCLGLITKIDLSNDPQQIAYSQKMLLAAGVQQVLAVSAVTGHNLKALKKLLT